MSDFKEVVKRLVMDQAFRNDLLTDVDGTLKAHNYTITKDELTEIKGLNQAHFDELDERFSNRLYSVGGTSLSGFKNFSTTVNTLGTQGVFSFGGFNPRIARPGGVAASGTW